MDPKKRKNFRQNLIERLEESERKTEELHVEPSTRSQEPRIDMEEAKKFDSLLDQQFSLNLSKKNTNAESVTGRGSTQLEESQERNLNNLKNLNEMARVKTLEDGKEDIELAQIKRDLVKRDKEKLDRYMKGFQKSPLDYVKDDSPDSAFFLAKLAEKSNDLDTAQFAQTNITRDLERTALESHYKRQVFEKNFRRHSRTWAFLRSGFLGADAWLLGVGLLALVTIPSYFFMEQKKVRARMKKKGLSMVSVHDLDPFDKDIDIDDVSVHTTYYDVEGNRKRNEMAMKFVEAREKLDREVYEEERRIKDKLLFGTQKEKEQAMKDLKERERAGFY